MMLIKFLGVRSAEEAKGSPRAKKIYMENLHRKPESDIFQAK